MKKMLVLALAAAMTLTTAAMPAMAENEDQNNTPAVTAEPTPTADPSATADPDAALDTAPTAEPSEAADPNDATPIPAPTPTPDTSATDDASVPEPTPDITFVEPVVSMQSAFVGRVKSVEEGYSNIEMADENMSVSTYTDGIKADDYVLVSYTSRGDLLSKISSWFHDEFLGKSIEFAIPSKKDYTASATRLDFAETIYSYLVSRGNVMTSENGSKFSDTDSTAVAALNAAGIINGVSDTEFDPDSPLTREAAATILARVYDYSNPNAFVAGNGTVYSDDSEISDWAKDGVYKLNALNMMQGTGEGKFSPKSRLTLEQSLAVILRNADNDRPIVMPVPDEIPAPEEGVNPEGAEGAIDPEEGMAAPADEEGTTDLAEGQENTDGAEPTPTPEPAE